MKAYYPSEDQFREPLVYIDGLLHDEEARSYGCVKIVPPASFKPPLAFDRESDRKIPTHYQVIQHLSQGKSFEENKEGHTFRELQELAVK